jgi:hypothetical protein
MRRRMLVLLALVVAGCGDPEPDTLPASSTAVTSDPKGTVLYGAGHVLLPAGVRVTVGHDPGSGGPSRRVRVTVDSGKHGGKWGAVRRQDLRPAK